MTDDVESIRVDRWAWLQMIASESGPPSPTTRHAMHAVSLHMNNRGESAWPSMETIATRMGGSVRAAKKHIKNASENGWLRVEKRRQPGRGWRVNEYRAAVPHYLAELIPKSRKQRAQGAPRRGRQGAPHSTTQCTSVLDAVHDVHTNSSVNNSINAEPPCAPNGAGGRSDVDHYPSAEYRTDSDRVMVYELEKNQSAGDNRNEQQPIDASI